MGDTWRAATRLVACPGRKRHQWTRGSDSSLDCGLAWGWERPAAAMASVARLGTNGSNGTRPRGRAVWRNGRERRIGCLGRSTTRWSRFWSTHAADIRAGGHGSYWRGSSGGTKDGTFQRRARSAILLRRRNLVKSRRRRHRVPPHVSRPGRYDKPNATWCADFKGWFRTGDGRRCDPLTISDGHSRFILGCRIVERPTFEYVRQQFERVFQENGLPDAIRTDNGPPFASTGLGGLSRLAVWWLKMGITPDRIEPGKPEQNGRHERFHKTLKAETASPPAGTPSSQQRRFDRFTREYNEDRPHALGNDTPSSRYAPSRRPYPNTLPDLVYPANHLVRSIRTAGTIKWHGSQIYVSETLVGECVGLEPIDEDQWLIRFASLPLAILDNRPRTAVLRRI